MRFRAIFSSAAALFLCLGGAAVADPAHPEASPAAEGAPLPPGGPKPAEEPDPRAEALSLSPEQRQAAGRKGASVNRICELIELHAEREGVPKEFFARLLWKESRFDAGAVSPVGAEGLAQFMPATAKAVGLADPFSIEQAIPASARHLRELKTVYGNWGLAAAAYNTGEPRVNRWLAGNSFLPIETENYVISILGEPADNFTDRTHAGTGPPIDQKLDFSQACRALPIIASRTVPMSRTPVKPWGVQVAGNFKRAAAIQQWERIKRNLGKFARSQSPVVSRVRSGRGVRGIYAVRIGAGSRAEANTICTQLRAAGGACMVMKNR